MKRTLPAKSFKLACVAALVALALPSGDIASAQSNCSQPCINGMRCIPAHAQAPAAHSGTHTCGGQYTEIAVDGQCATGTAAEGCDLGLGLVLIRTFACSQQGASCAHTLISSAYTYACNC